MGEFAGILGTARSNWLVTGAAGFIGSNLVEALLAEGQTVVGLDNFATGRQQNLDEVRQQVGSQAWSRFRFIEGDIRSAQTCAQAAQGVDFVLHQAALGSVPRSIASPIDSFDTNVAGFVQMLTAARDAGVRRFVYASSSSVYGDSPDLPKSEARVGRPLSPYAATKTANELFADVWARTYAMRCVGLRYFNVFGPRQDPDGPYAAVVPRWVSGMLRGQPCLIYGDGQTSRDFCFVKNAVQANLRAALAEGEMGPHEVFNVACGDQTSLLTLFDLLGDALASRMSAQSRPFAKASPELRDFRAGDVRHSLASIDKARDLLGYQPTHTVRQGIDEALDWYIRQES